MDPWPQYRTDIPYSTESRLNTLEWCIPRPTSRRDSKNIWVVYIHGGAWRDPLINATSFDKAQSILLHTPEVVHIAGFASINYRLSSYPSHPSRPSNPSDNARNARHPDHINDVLKALIHLQETFQFASQYILVGHSCGATLALQVAMKRYWGESTPGIDLKVDPPLAVLALEGIYDLEALVNAHRDISAYQEFVVNAFGTDVSLWNNVSPARADFNHGWPGGKLIVLAHSHEDELVEWAQVDLQLAALKSQGWRDVQSDSERRVRTFELQGKHDDMWIYGEELARAIQTTVQEVVRLL